MESLVNKVIAYNREIRDALRLLYTSLPPGQQRTIVKNEAVKELLLRYRVIEEETHGR